MRAAISKGWREKREGVSELGGLAKIKTVCMLCM